MHIRMYVWAYVRVYVRMYAYVPVVLLQIRKTLKGPDLYDSFLRCLYLFNEEIITRGELVNLVSGWLG